MWSTCYKHPPHQEYELKMEEYMKETLRKQEEEVCETCAVECHYLCRSCVYKKSRDECCLRLEWQPWKKKRRDNVSI